MPRNRPVRAMVLITVALVAPGACKSGSRAHGPTSTATAARFTLVVDTTGMAPVFQPRDTVEIVATDQPLQRGMIVATHTPPGQPDATLIKRVLGLPGETIEGRDGHIVVNGVELVEPYLRPGRQSSAFIAVTVPADSYWLLGDNRLDSKDSRFYGPFPRSAIVGRVTAILSPRLRARRLPTIPSAR